MTHNGLMDARTDKRMRKNVMYYVNTATTLQCPPLRLIETAVSGSVLRRLHSDISATHLCKHKRVHENTTLLPAVKLKPRP